MSNESVLLYIYCWVTLLARQGQSCTADWTLAPVLAGFLGLMNGGCITEPGSPAPPALSFHFIHFAPSFYISVREIHRQFFIGAFRGHKRRLQFLRPCGSELGCCVGGDCVRSMLGLGFRYQIIFCKISCVSFFVFLRFGSF